jgi:hypothetical protein
VFNFDFYLQGVLLGICRDSFEMITDFATLEAHGDMQGTSRSTHYFVIHNEIGLPPDQLQALTNSVSYMFARATKAVSLVSPAYYAHLACERGRCYLYEMLQGHTKDPAAATSGDEHQVMREAERYWVTGPTGPSIKDTMFYL